MRFASWAGVVGWEELAGLFTFGTLEFNGGVGGIYIYIHMCAIYICGCIYRGGRCRHIQREKLVRCGDWRTYVDPVLPGVRVGVVGDMRHVIQ